MNNPYSNVATFLLPDFEKGRDNIRRCIFERTGEYRAKNKQV